MQQAFPSTTPGQLLGYDQWRHALARVPLPAAVVDLDAFDRNVSLFTAALAQAGGKQRIRLATKSVRVPALIRRVLDASPVFQGLMAYCSTEAAFLASEGFNDLLIAYPSVQASDLAILRAIHERGVTIRLMIDSLEQALIINDAMNGVAKPFELALDIDMSLRFLSGRVHLGVRRSPIRSVESAMNVIRAVAKLPNVRCRSAMGYEAQVAGLGDENPFKKRLAPVARMVRKMSRTRIARLREEFAHSMQKEGTPLELFNGGGSGSITYTATEPWLTELTIGSGLLCSHLFSYFSNIRPEPACFFVLPVVRTSDAGYVTCQGGGYIASGEPGWDKVPVPYLPSGLKLVAMEGCGEVQTPLLVEQGTTVGLADPVLFRHAKAGELAEHFNTYHLVAHGRIVDEVPTYRGRGCSFIG
ncbi:alanine racemase [bacterium]|nr:alanine racemase [bacterium]